MIVSNCSLFVKAVKEGKALEIGQRMLEATSNVLHAVHERSRGGNSGGTGPPGGAPPV